MHQLFSQRWLGLAGLSWAVLSSQPMMAMVPINVAVIVNSGSTNTIGYRIYVSPSGEVRYVDGKGSGQGKLSPPLVKKFFQDLKKAEPLGNLSVQKSCVKSTSFGTSTTISLGSERSPDLSCPGNSKARHLKDDVSAIAKTLKVENIPQSQGKPLPVQNF